MELTKEEKEERILLEELRDDLQKDYLPIKKQLDILQKKYEGKTHGLKYMNSAYQNKKGETIVEFVLSINFKHQLGLVIG